MTHGPLTLLLIVLLSGHPNTAPLPQSEMPGGQMELSQVYGGNCQTPFGTCPLLDKNGVPQQLPIGSTCQCGTDEGTVVQ